MRIIGVLATLVSVGAAFLLLKEYPDSPKSAIDSLYIIICASFLAFLIEFLSMRFGGRSHENEVNLTITDKTLKNIEKISLRNSQATSCAHCNATGLCCCPICSKYDSTLVERINKEDLYKRSLSSRSTTSQYGIKFHKCSCCEGTGTVQAKTNINYNTTISGDLECEPFEAIQNLAIKRIDAEIELVEKKESSNRRMAELEQLLLDKRITLAKLKIKTRSIFSKFWN